MLRKWILADVKYAFRSGVTFLLLVIFFFLTLSGIYFGRLKLDEIRMVDRGNDKVVNVSNTGSFTGRLETVLDRNLRYSTDSTEEVARFLASRLVQFWLWSGIVLVLIYGYYFLTREKDSHVLVSLIAGPATLRDYYWVKVFSGFCYWGIFLLFYGGVVGGAAYLFLKVSSEFILTFASGMVLLWGYFFMLWIIYLLVNLFPRAQWKNGSFYLVLVLILAFFLPVLGQVWVMANGPVRPEAPQISQSSSILAFVPERRRTESENTQIEADLWNLAVYRKELAVYLVRGIQLEEQAAYLSPVLVTGRVLKSLFRPEIVYCKDFLLGKQVKLSPQELFSKQADYLKYLGIIGLALVFLPALLIKRLEMPE